MSAMSILKGAICIVLFIASLFAIAATLLMDKSEGDNLSVINGINETMRSKVTNTKKNTLNRIVIVTMTIILVLTAIIYVLSAKGVL